MKTLLIMQDFLPDLPGGIANYVYRLCHDLAPTIEALVPAYGNYTPFDGAQAFPIHRQRIPVEPPAFMRESRWHWLRLPYIFYIALAQFLLFTWHGLRKAQQRQIQVLLIGHLYLAPVGWLLSRLLRKPYGVILYGGELHRYFHWPFVRLPLLAVLNRANFLVVITRFAQQHYIERGVRPDQRFVQVYPGVDTQRFQPGLDATPLRRRLHLNGQTTILTVARLVDWKGHTAVLQALPHIIQEVPNVHYLITGNGPYRSDLEQMVQNMGLTKYVTFAGFIPDVELPAVYCSADLFVQASRKTGQETAIEGFGIVFVEASACGIPVIGGRTGGTNEAIAEGFSGLLVDPDDVNGLAAAIIQLLQDRTYARQLGQQGRERAVAEFDWSIQTARLRTFLQELGNAR